MSQHKAQQGFLTFAQNTDTVDYLQLAYLQALNIKATQSNNLVAVVVDQTTKELVNDSHRDVFDYIIDLPVDHNEPSSNWKLANEYQAFWLTPFKETIKLESDLLFTRSIDHWWTAFRLKNICLSTGCRDYRGRLSMSRKYRQVFDDNRLPDVYNGLMYFRFSQEAHKFFTVAQEVQNNWTDIQNNLKNCHEEIPSTDLLYAIAALLLGPEICTAPSLNFINFVHMKPAINGFSETLSFQDAFVTEFDSGMIRINNINQYHPLHYYDKTFATNELIEYYERSRISKST
jgi:hypothetical protein